MGGYTALKQLLPPAALHSPKDSVMDFCIISQYTFYVKALFWVVIGFKSFLSHILSSDHCSIDGNIPRSAESNGAMNAKGKPSSSALNMLNGKDRLIKILV